jgi:hypothetical protein
MKSKILAFLLPAACGAALAITLSVAAAEQPPAPSRATSETPATPARQYSEYRNDQWHFSIAVPSNLTAQSSENEGGATIQFMDPRGDELFQVSAWPYQDLDIALGEEAPAGSAGDQSDSLAIVHVLHNDLLEIAFDKNGISYLVQATNGDATSTLDILKSWQFI